MRSTVRAPAMTASARARSSSKSSRSRRLLNGTKWRVVGANLPSAVVATLIKTNGSLGRKLAFGLSFGFEVDGRFGEFGQLLIGAFFLIESLAKQVFDILASQDVGPCCSAAVASDLVVLDFLRRHDDGGVPGFRRAFVTHDLVGFINNSRHPSALGAFGR